MKDVLYIVVPAYNESENIEALVNDWYPVIEHHSGEGASRLVVINDGSKDDTYEKLCLLAETRPLLKPLTKENGGHGSTLLFGYRYAIENGADWIFQTDSDGQTLPQEFEPFWEKREEYDAILGDRSAREDGASRKFVENVVRLLLRLYFGVKVPDANAPFRLMKRELVAKYIEKLPKNFNLPNIMFTTYFAYFREKLCFEKITFRNRQGGVNSINIKKIVKIGMKALGDFSRLKKDIKK